MRYKRFALAFFGMTTTALFGFDWPQKEIESASFYSYFGQMRGGTLSPSLVFTDSDDIKAADSGRAIVTISEHAESDLFESTLGNAIIIAHKDNLQTVYANLSETQQEDREALTTVQTGAFLGTCSNSGWQEGHGCLEFQVVDAENKAFINPRVLMPRFGDELELELRNITAISKKGVAIVFGIQRTISAGFYSIYKQRQDKAMPYKTTIYINGVEVQSIPYDRLIQVKNKLCTSGLKNYDVKALYPDAKRELVGDVNLPHGKSTITIAATDILGNEKTITYNIDVR